jgi:hypothetical protein
VGDVPGSAVLQLFDQIIDRVKQTRSVRTDNKPLENDFVYSQMILGMPVNPDDYLHPWTPALGSAGQPGGPPAAAPAASAPAPSTNGSGAPDPLAGAGDPSGGLPSFPAPAPVDPRAAKALNAAFNTSTLCNTMLQVTANNEYVEYPVGRHLSFQYESILTGMQALPAPPMSDAVKKQLADAQKVLYVPDPDNTDDADATVRSSAYKTYVKNAKAYAQAKADYVTAFAEAKRDPAKADAWPIASATYRQTLDDAWDQLKAQGAAKVEAALDVIKSIGLPMQDHEIARARSVFERYNVDFGGLGVTIPYSYVMPSAWCDPNNDDEGWQHLTVTQSSAASYSSMNFSRGSQSSWSHDSSSNSGGGAVSFGFAAFGGSAGHTQSSGQSQGSSGYTFSSAFGNTAQDLTIDIEYMLCTINRDWLASDLFYMKNWYVVNNDKFSISDGTISHQLGNATQLIPMIPQQFLVIRNVNISSKHWGSDGAVLSSAFDSSQGSTSASSTSVAASGGVCLGFMTIGGTGAHSDAHAQGQQSSSGTKNASSVLHTSFDGTTLSIPGAQIVAFVSNIVPASPPLPDPGLKAAAPKPAAATATKTTPTVSGATTGKTPVGARP